MAQGINLDSNCLVSFATVEEARSILTRRDEFIAALSPFDRAARMKTNGVVSEKEFLEFLGRNALPWLPDETNKITAVLETLRQRLAPWHLPFPPAITLIKTSGREEGGASYTRQNAVVLVQRDARSPGDLEGVITHELFHVLSRHNPELRKRLYRIVGFHPISEIDYPRELQPRRITNPDGVQSGWAIQITNQNQALSAVPILFASASHYDPQKGGEFFDYLNFRLLAVTDSDGIWEPKLIEGRPYLVQPQQVQGFFEQVGRNTGYILHPDEILAENFVHMIKRTTNLATPRIVEDMESVFKHR